MNDSGARKSIGTDIPAGQLRWFVASDGYRLAFRHYPATTAPAGTIVALHGIQSHSAWYGRTSQQLAGAGYEVFFLDRRGSGENGTQRGHAPHADRLLNDVRQFAGFVSRETQTQPTLLGLSWGGKLAFVAAGRMPELFANLVLLYPGLRARFGPNWFQRKLLKAISNSRRAKKRIRIPHLTASLFTDDPDWQQFIRDDHLALQYASLAFLHASVTLDEEVATAAKNLAMPMRVLLAGGDRIINNIDTRELVRQCSNSERSVVEYAGAAHTLEFEPNRAAIVDDLIKWLDQGEEMK